MNTDIKSSSSVTSRRAVVTRQTRETKIHVQLDLDGTGQSEIKTSIGFLDHMLDQFAHYGGIDLIVHAQGDLHIDDHHTTEDIGIVIGQAFDQALGDRCGIMRFGTAYVPMDEALSRVVIDLSGRPYLAWNVTITKEYLGTLSSDLIREWFQGVTNHLRAAIHVECLYGINDHHIVESCYKGFALALRNAILIDSRMASRIPSTKGTLVK